MATPDMIIKRGDTTPPVRATLYADDNQTTPLDLTAATSVNFVMSKTAVVGRSTVPGEVTVNAPCAITDAATGKVTYTWASDGTDTATADTYLCEFEITWTDGTIRTIPYKDYKTILITEDID